MLKLAVHLKHEMIGTWQRFQYYQILCTLKHVEDVKDRSSTLKGCNAMYVEDGICSLYATLHTELLILLLMSKVSKMSNTLNN